MTIQDCTQFDLYMIEIGQWEIVEWQLRRTNAGYISSERIKQGYASWLKNNKDK